MECGGSTPLSPVAKRLVRLLFLAFLAAARTTGAWTGAPSPHDEQHLIVLRPAQFRAAEGQALKLVADAAAAFAKEAAPAERVIVAAFTVRHPGKYVLWVRAAQKKGLATPLAAEIRRGDAAVLKGALLDGPGALGRGGPAAFDAYSEQAMKRSPEGKAVGGHGLEAAKKEGDEGIEAAADEALAELRKPGSKDAWVHLARIESVSGDRPFHWWKIGAAELAAGAHELRISPQAGIPAECVPLVDAAFLTTYPDLVYPYAGDMDAPKASYVRFRVEKCPPTGLAISAALRIHSDPWSTPRVWLNPSGMSTKDREAHEKPGFTRWFRLQDIERAPAFGSAECCLLLQVSAALPKDAAAPIKGATQFAVFPHQDCVLREIAWDEPDGLSLSMATDFESRLHLLRTFRDHERENYERALAATGNRLFPLTRGGLYFTNSWGAASGAAYDYMLKTLRLLGFNNAGVAHDPVRARQLYGWTSHAGQYWPPAFLPYDEAEARRKYDRHYEHFFDKEREFYEGVPIYQIADEPGEIAKTEVSAPLWVYDEKAGKWLDPVGGSDLSTRALLSHCVLEGKVEQHGEAIGFRVAIDDPQKPTRFAYWESGRVGPSTTVNIAAGRVGLPTDSRSTMHRPGGSVGRAPTPFKIVLEGDSAALYLNGALIHQHANLPEKGAVGFSGGPKAITELRIRGIRKDEHIVARSPVGTAKELKLAPAEDDELVLEPGEDDPSRRLHAFGRLPKGGRLYPPEGMEPSGGEDWVASGGIAEAHAGFRKWAAAQGLRPELFGKKSWDEVRLLTIPSLARTPEDARRYYWSRRYNGYLTPHMFGLAADAIAKHAPNPRMKGFVALSGHALYFPSEMPLDMFALADHGGALIPGISDWMSLGTWRWDSHQAVAFSVAPYNAGARWWEGEAPAEPGRKNGSAGASPSRRAADGGAEPVSYPMMHCVWPAVIRSYTMLANNVKTISYFNYGPAYAVTEGSWSDSEWAYEAVHLTDNHAALVDDVLAAARMRPSRVALLYAHSTEYWNAQSSFADKRAAFLALSHEYFQPELVTEEQITDGALKHYDALYALEPWVTAAAQEQIGKWVRGGGLLCAYADALTRNEYDEPTDLLPRLAGIRRTPPPEAQAADGSHLSHSSHPSHPSHSELRPVAGEAAFRPHTVAAQGMPAAIEADGARVRAKYSDGRPAWIERAVEKGKVVYLGHRPGLTYTAKAIRRPGYHDVWADTGRASLTLPLLEAKVERELVLSEPLIMASALSSDAGTVIILYNMHPTPRANLRIELKEPQRPHSVEAFDGDSLAPLPFERRDGRVVMTLPKLDGGQMVLVRRCPAPPDGRRAKMRERTEQQLASTEWPALAAGAWFAGFHPGWGLAGRLVPLLGHERWEVRRAAAETLGRLGHRAASEALLAALEKETDAHALGDELAALARLGSQRAAEFARQGLSHRDPFVRRQAVAAISILGRMPGGGASAPHGKEPPAAGPPAPQPDRAPGGTLPGLLATALDAGLRDPDLRVRREAIPLAVLLDSPRALVLAGEAFAEGGRDPLERPHWADALARDGQALAEYLDQNLAKGDGLLLALAARRADARLAQALRDRCEELARRDPAAFVTAALRQRDPALARLLFERREALPRAVASHVTLILENAFEARLGDVLEDWAGWLRVQ